MIRIRQALSAQKTVLEAVFQASLDLAVLRTAWDCSSPTEPDYVYGVFRDFIDDADAELKRALQSSGISSAVSGVFCHQSPQVRLDKPARNGKDQCEIGDLLVTVRYDVTPVPLNWAMLLQFKKQYAKSARLPTSTPQFDLYNKWTPFKYVAGYMPNRCMTVSPPAPHDGGKYALVLPQASQANAQRTFSKVAAARGHEEPLGREVVDMVLGLSGREFDNKPSSSTCDWSQVVWDLLDQTANRAFNLQSSSVQGQPRGRVHTMLATAGNRIPSLVGEALAASGDRIPPSWRAGYIPLEEAGHNAPEGGISTIFFEFGHKHE